ncbi:MAG: type III pantothenate kinase [Gammaproteobacteria bacterium]|jgi:type III pantothenate kinase|nr:type III pantothenate kinase [Gammaproteobacteria bacterium]
MLLVDIGNTRLKWRLHNINDAGQAMPEVIQRGSILAKGLTAEALSQALPTGTRALWFASVASEAVNAQLLTWAVQHQIEWRQAHTRPQWQDLINAYADCSRMGVDRWLAMVATRQLTRQSACVIDCGSASTVDFIAASGQHEGGYIIPGQHLMAQSLLQDTAQIAFTQQESEAHAGYGVSTAGAVLKGTQQFHELGIGAIAEQALRSGYKVYATGGDGEFLTPNQAIDYIDELVLDGLLACLYDGLC